MNSNASNTSPVSRCLGWKSSSRLASRPALPGLRSWRSLRAFTVIETLVATLVVLTAMGAIFHVGGRCIGIVRCSHNVAVASAMLQERIQQLQATPWEALTDSDSYQDQVWTDPEDGSTENVAGILKTATLSGSALPLQNIVETVRVSAYRPVAVADPLPTPISATRTASTATLTSAVTSLADEKMVRIDLRVTWTEGQAALPRSLGSSAIVARK